MKQIIQKIALGTSSLFVAFSMSVSPVLAHSAVARGEDDTHSETETPTPTVAETSDSSGREDRATKVEELKKKLEEKKAKAQSRIEEIKSNASEKTAEVREKACSARKNAFQKRMENAVAQAEKHKAVFDKIFTRVQDFKESNAVSVESYESLVAAANAAGVKVDDAIAALQSLNTDVDCTDPDAAATALSAFKETVTEAKTALKDYRTSIKNVLVAVKASVPSDDSEDSPTPTATPSSTTTPTPTESQ